MDYPLLVDLIKNILNFLTIAMSSIIREISAMFFSTVRITILKLTFPMKINRKGLPKKTDMTLLSDRHFSWMQIWCRVAMQMYPGNESEKPYIRKVIEEMKSRYKVSGKTVQVADKGLNCARNIYAAVKEANDGYIFSKSIHGRNLSEKKKEMALIGK